MRLLSEITHPKHAENHALRGVQMTVILSTECSGGKLTIIEQEIDVDAGLATPMCNREDKVILITEGLFIIYANGKKHEAGKGTNIFIPGGTLHSYKNGGTQIGRLLITFTPADNNTSKKDGRQIKVIHKTLNAATIKRYAVSLL